MRVPDPPSKSLLPASALPALPSLHSLQVFTVAGGRVTRNVVFADPHVFEAFDLPTQVSAG